MPGDPLLLPLSDIRWPYGEHLIDPSAAAAAAALSSDRWVDLKLRSGRWYLQTLRELRPRTGADRYAGVEMALDGCLSNLSGAVDAAQARLILALERQLNATPSPVHTYGLATVRRLVRDGGHVPSLALLEAALAGMSDSHPVGWLARLRRHRNRSAHQTTLSRHHDQAGSGRLAVIGLSVDGFDGPVDAVDWLEKCLGEAVQLCRELLADAAATGHHVPD